jgi:hypothetical protein
MPRGSELRKRFNTHLTQYLQSKGKRGVLYLPQRYNEYEMRMFDPRDVVMLDFRNLEDAGVKRFADRMYGMAPKSTARDAIFDWGLQGAGGQPSNLGAIYRDIKLHDVRLPDPETIKNERGLVMLKALSNAKQAEHPGLRVGSTSPKRVREEQIPDFKASVDAPPTP